MTNDTPESGTQHTLDGIEFGDELVIDGEDGYEVKKVEDDDFRDERIITVVARGDSGRIRLQEWIPGYVSLATRSPLGDWALTPGSSEVDRRA